MPTTMEVEPGAWIQLQEEDLTLQKYIADLQATIDRLQIGLGKEANEIERQRLRWQIQQAKDDLEFRREELAEKRKVTELGLATSPIDFVAYEMYKRYLHQQATKGQAAVSPSEAAPAIYGMLGETPPPGYVPEPSPHVPKPATGEQLVQVPRKPSASGLVQVPRKPGEQLTQAPRRPSPPPAQAPGQPSPTPGFAGPYGTVHTDQEIQAMIEALVGPGGGSLGVGAFDVAVPMTQAISRQEGRALSQDEMAILSSFLRAGFKANGQEVSYDPADYWREVEEGWIPTLRVPAATQYSF